MARGKRIWRESQHPRDGKGRFSKRGGAAWVKRAAAELTQLAGEAGNATRGDGGRPRISRNAKAGAVLQAHTDGGRPSPVRVPKAVKTAGPTVNVAAFNAPGTPAARPQLPKKRTPRPSPAAAALIEARAAEQAPHVPAMVAARTAPEGAPVPGAADYASMRQHTLVSLARQAGVPHRNRSRTDIANDLAARDAKVKADRKAKLNPSGTGVDTPRDTSNNGGMTSTTNTPGPYGAPGDPIPSRGSQGWNRAVDAMQIVGPGGGPDRPMTPYANRAPEVGDTVTAGGLNRKGTVVRAIRRNRTDGFDVQWEGEPYTRHQSGSSLGVVDVPEVIRRGRGEGAPKVEAPRTPSTTRGRIPRDTKAALMASDGPLGRDGKPIEAKPRKVVPAPVEKTPTRRLQTFSERMAGDMSERDLLAARLDREEQSQQLRVREAEAARLRAEARANDTRSERERLAEQLQQDRDADHVDMRSGRRNPQRLARMRKIEARLEELDTEDRKAKIKDIKKGDRVTTTYGGEAVEVEAVGKTKDGYLRVLLPNGRRGSLDPKFIKEVTPAPKADAAPVAAAVTPERHITDLENQRRGLDITSPEWRRLTDEIKAARKAAYGTQPKVSARQEKADIAAARERADAEALQGQVLARRARLAGQQAAPAAAPARGRISPDAKRGALARVDTSRVKSQNGGMTNTKPGETTLGVTESSRGRTTTVTLPDGSTAQRTSKTMDYTHAVVATHDLHADARDLRAEAEVAQRYADAYAEWIANGSNLGDLIAAPNGTGSFRDAEAGLINYSHYLPGFAPNQMRHRNGATWTEAQRGTFAITTSQRHRSGGAHTYSNYEGYQNHEANLAKARADVQARLARAAKIEAGPAEDYYVARWSQRADTAHAALGSAELSARNTRYQVIGVGGVASAPGKPAKKVPTAAEKAAALEAKKAAEKARQAASDQQFVDRTRAAVERAIDEGTDPEDALKSKTDKALRFMAKSVGAKLPRKPQTAYGSPAPLDTAEARRLIVEAIRRARSAEGKA